MKETIAKARKEASEVPINPWFYQPFREARIGFFLSERAKAVKTLKRELKKDGSLPECLGSSKNITLEEYTAENNPRIGIRQWVTKELAVTIPLKKDGFHSLVLRFPTEGNPADQVYPQTDTVLVRVEVYGKVGNEALPFPYFLKETRLDGFHCTSEESVADALNYIGLDYQAGINAVTKYINRLDTEI